MNNRNRIKFMAGIMVLAMLMVSFVPVNDDTGMDAAVGDGGAYSYTLTYDSSKMSSNQSTNSALSVTGMDAIYHPSYSGGTTSGYGDWTWNTTTGIGPFNSFYAAFDMTNGNSFYAILNPFDLTKTIDGTSLSPLSNYNIMWVLPTVYISSTATTLTLSNDPSSGTAYAHTINGHVYKYIAIGVYEGATKTVGGQTVLTSESGSTPTVSQTRATFRTYAHNYTMSSDLKDSSDVAAYSMQWNFYQWELYKYCSWILMENFNSQATVGGGHTYGSTYVFTTGATNTSGPYAGTPMASSSDASTHGLDQVKLFIEGAWGGIREFVDGVVINGTSGYYVDTKSTPNDSTTEGGYVSYFADALPSSSGYPSSIATSHTQTWGMGGNSTSGSETTGLTDYTYTSTGGNYVLNVGGTSNADASSSVRYGLACAYASSDVSSSYSNLGSRLAFVFDAGPASTRAIFLEPNNATYGTVNNTTSVTISDVADGTTISVSGSSITIGSTTVTAAPLTDPTGQYTYTFSEWNTAQDGSGTTLTGNSNTVSGDMNIYAIFTATVNQYTVTLSVYPAGGGTLSTSSFTVNYGTTISASGNVLTLTYGGSTVGTSTATATTGDPHSTYTFSSWNTAADETGTDIETSGATVQGDMTIFCVFDAETQQFTVTVQSNNSSMGKVNNAASVQYTVDYGTTITTNGNVLSVGSNTVTATPESADAQYTYAFGTWTGTSATVTGDMTIVANFTATVNNYPVTITAYPSGYGTVTTATFGSVPYGATISASSNVLTVGSVGTSAANAKAADAQYTYIFDSFNTAQDGTGTNIGTTSITVTGATTVYAIFTTTTNEYTVTVVPNDSDYGSVNSTTSVTVSNVPYGTTVSVNGATIGVSSTVITAAAESATAQYTYAFDGWSISNGYEITGNTTITANFTATVNKYTITVNSSNTDYGTVEYVGSLTNIPYGSVIDITGNELTVNGTTVTATENSATVYYTYTFTGYSVNDETIVTGDMTITANFTAPVTTFIIIITPNDSDYGSVTVSQISGVTYGQTYTITTTTNPGDTLDIGGASSQAVPEAQDAQYTYSFAGWYDPDGVQISDGDSFTPSSPDDQTTITARFTAAVRSYTVSVAVYSSTPWGSVVPATSVTVEYGTLITISGDTLNVGSTAYSPAPYAQGDQYTYSFAGWVDSNGDPIVSGSSVSGAQTIYASFARELRNYTVIFDVNDDAYGSVSPTTVTAPYGSGFTVNDNVVTVTAPVGSGIVIRDPQVTATSANSTAQYAYVFTSWDVTGASTVTGDMTVTATFTPTLRNYTVTVVPNDASYGKVNNQSSVTVSSIPYGTEITSSDNTLDVNGTTVTATYNTPSAQYTYGWGSWSIGESVTLQGDMTITAIFTTTTNDYTLTFAVNNSDYGSVDADTLTVPYGSVFDISGNVLIVDGHTVTATATPQEPEWTYTFSSWSVSDEASVTGDMTITASFSRAKSVYTVTIVPNNSNYGTVSPTTVSNVQYGTSLTAVSNVLSVGSVQNVTATANAADAQYTYAWGSWTIPEATVSGNVTVTANFTATLNPYTITWVVGEDETEQTFLYGEMPTRADPAAPEGYVFQKWTPVLVPVTGDATYTAVFIVEVPVQVTFVLSPGSYLSPASQSLVQTKYVGLTYGDMPHVARSNYTFIGWFTEPDGEGDLILSTTEVTNAEAHSLYCYFEPSVVYVPIKSMVDMIPLITVVAIIAILIGTAMYRRG